MGDGPLEVVRGDHDHRCGRREGGEVVRGDPELEGRARSRSRESRDGRAAAPVQLRVRGELEEAGGLDASRAPEDLRDILRAEGLDLVPRCGGTVRVEERIE